MKEKINLKRGLALGLVVIILVVMFGLTAGSQPEIGEPWPSFTMVYREYRHPNGYPENLDLEPLEYDTWKLEYINLRNWKLTLIDSTYKPEVIGEWSSFDGQVYRSYSPILRTIDEIPNKEIVVPNDWLSPGMMDRLPDNDYMVVERTSGTTRYRLTVSDFMCREGPPICPGGKMNYVYTSEFVFNDEGIPVEVIDKLDDIVSRHIVLLDLTFK